MRERDIANIATRVDNNPIGLLSKSMTFQVKQKQINHGCIFLGTVKHVYYEMI